MFFTGCGTVMSIAVTSGEVLWVHQREAGVNAPRPEVEAFLLCKDFFKNRQTHLHNDE